MVLLAQFLPFFALVALGWWATRRGVIPLGNYALAGAVLLGLMALWARAQRLAPRDAGMAALATVFPNTGFLGLPLLTGLLGAGVQAGARGG